MRVTPHVAQKPGAARAAAPSVIERRDTAAIGSARRRGSKSRVFRLAEETIALLRKVRHRGTLKVDWIFTFACAAYNLVRMRNLMAVRGSSGVSPGRSGSERL